MVTFSLKLLIYIVTSTKICHLTLIINKVCFIYLKINQQDMKGHRPNKSKEIKFTTHHQNSHASIYFASLLYNIIVCVCVCIYIIIFYICIYIYIDMYYLTLTNQQRCCLLFCLLTFFLQ